MDDTVENQHENQHDFLPPSPPIQDAKSPQESHYQSSSAPVGRPPPLIFEELVDFFDELESQDTTQEDSTNCVVDQDQQFQDFTVDDALPEMDVSYSDYALFPVLKST